MSRHRPRSRASRPSPEVLESRQLLSAVVSGTDIDGDKWVLVLNGPGDLRVTNQPDSNGAAVPLTQPGSIDTITIGGADPNKTTLTGYVTQAAGGDGKVFFSNLTELGGRSESIPAPNGIGAIDMPNFWLGNTSTSAPTSTTAPSINIPDGVVTLRFGGADTTYTPPGGTNLNTDGTSTTFNVSLGIPRTLGTSIIVDKVVTDAQAASSSTGSPTQDSVVFSVQGRINVFQANEIDGNTSFPATGLVGGGGTIVQSLPLAVQQRRGQHRVRPGRRQCHGFRGPDLGPGQQLLHWRRNELRDAGRCQRDAKYPVRQGDGQHHHPLALHRDLAGESRRDRLAGHGRPQRWPNHRRRRREELPVPLGLCGRLRDDPEPPDAPHHSACHAGRRGDEQRVDRRQRHRLDLRRVGRSLHRSRHERLSVRRPTGSPVPSRAHQGQGRGHGQQLQRSRPTTRTRLSMPRVCSRARGRCCLRRCPRRPSHTPTRRPTALGSCSTFSRQADWPSRRS